MSKENILSINDKWLVLSPKRTGSKVIVDFLLNVYFNTLKIVPPYINPSNQETEIDKTGKIIDKGDATLFFDKNSFIKHSHELDDYFKLKDDPSVKIVVSTRNIVESSLSWLILIKSSEQFHNYNENHKPVINKFLLNVDEFLKIYNDMRNFYVWLSNVNKETIIIDYEEFKDDFRSLYRLLNITEHNSETIWTLPIKNIPHHEWIINWEEIQPLLNSLEQEIILKKT